MYGKFFASAFTGSMYGKGVHVFALWAYAVSNSDRAGCVEINCERVAAILGCSEAEMESALALLCAPDPRSRSKEEEGRRLLREGEFIFRLVNYEKYRQIRNEEERREQNRVAQAKWREKQKLMTVTDSKPGVSNSKHGVSTDKQSKPRTEAEAEVSNPNPSAETPRQVDVAEKIYQLYPRKVGKRDAVKAIGFALKNNAAEKLESAVTAYAAAVALWPESERQQFVPHPATWFNRGSFDDDPAAWVRASRLPGGRPSNNIAEITDLKNRRTNYPDFQNDEALTATNREKRREIDRQIAALQGTP